MNSDAMQDTPLPGTGERSPVSHLSFSRKHAQDRQRAAPADLRGFRASTTQHSPLPRTSPGDLEPSVAALDAQIANSLCTGTGINEAVVHRQQEVNSAPVEPQHGTAVGKSPDHHAELHMQYSHRFQASETGEQPSGAYCEFGCF